MNTKSDEKLGTEHILKLMLTMGIPTFVAQLINLLYNIVDRIYIGHINGAGANALTGLGITLPIITIITAFSVFAGGGGAPLAAIAMGKGDNARAHKILGNATAMLICFSIVLTAVFLYFKEPLLYAMGASKDTFPYANDYITIYLTGTIFVQLAMGLNTFITAQGRAKTAMISVVIGAVLNISLDPIFIFGFNMGVKGAAIATVISQACSAIWIVVVLISKKSVLRIKPKYLKPDFHIIASVAALGISPFIMQVTESLVIVVLNSGLKKYGGDIYVGSLTILQSIMQLIFVPLNGFSQGVQPIISYNYGAGKIDRVKDTFKWLLVINMLASALISALAMIFPKLFASFFTNSAELIDIVGKVLPVYIAGMLVFGIQTGCQSTFMALGQAKISLFFALLRKVILLVPLAIILPAIMQDIMGIYYAEAIADTLAALTCGTVFLFTYKKILDKAV